MEKNTPPEFQLEEKQGDGDGLEPISKKENEERYSGGIQEHGEASIKTVRAITRGWRLDRVKQIKLRIIQMANEMSMRYNREQMYWDRTYYSPESR